MAKYILAGLFSLCALCGLCGQFQAGQPVSRFTFNEPHMGTRFKIIVCAPDEAAAKSAVKAAFQRIAGLEPAHNSPGNGPRDLLYTHRLARGLILQIHPELLVPLVAKEGIDQFHFGIIVTVNLAVGMFVPPFGLNLFATHALFGIQLQSLYRGILPFLAIYLTALSGFYAVQH